MASATNAKKKPKKAGFLSKLMGGKAKDASPSPKPKPKPAPESKPAPKVNKDWPAPRLNVVEKLWGEGYVTPGGAEQVLKLMPLLHLDKKKSLLLLGAGLGGINETMVEATGVWVTGLERERELAEIGHASMQRAGLKRQAPVRYSTLEDVELKPKSFDAVVSFEGIDAVVDKKALFTAVCESLRIDGNIMFTTLALPDTNPPNDAVKAWIAGERKSATPHPWPIAALTALLTSLNMEVRPVEDITLEYRGWVMKGFSTMLAGLSHTQLKEMGVEIMGELENWTRRTKAIESGGLKVVRIHAIRLPEKRKDISELMAEKSA